MGGRVAEARGKGGCSRCPRGEGLEPSVQSNWLGERQEGDYLTGEEVEDSQLEELGIWEREAIRRVLCVRKIVDSGLTGLLLGTGRTAHSRCIKKGGDQRPVGPSQWVSQPGCSWEEKCRPCHAATTLPRGASSSLKAGASH